MTGGAAQSPLTAIEAARKKAIGLNPQMCIAVVDSGANLKAFLRMDDAWVGSIDIAIKKAKTACFFGMATGQLGKLSQPGKPLYAIEHSNDGLITFPGGLPPGKWSASFTWPSANCSVASKLPDMTMTRACLGFVVPPAHQEKCWWPRDSRTAKSAVGDAPAQRRPIGVRKRLRLPGATMHACKAPEKSEGNASR